MIIILSFKHSLIWRPREKHFSLKYDADIKVT